MADGGAVVYVNLMLKRLMEADIPRLLTALEKIGEVLAAHEFNITRLVSVAEKLTNILIANEPVVQVKPHHRSASKMIADEVREQLLMAAPSVVSPVRPSGWQAGMEEASRIIDSMAERHVYSQRTVLIEAARELRRKIPR